MGRRQSCAFWNALICKEREKCVTKVSFLCKKEKTISIYSVVYNPYFWVNLSFPSNGIYGHGFQTSTNPCLEGEQRFNSQTKAQERK
jgi:hypothetical protein